MTAAPRVAPGERSGEPTSGGWVRAAVIALPPLLLAGVGTTHARTLTTATADTWWHAHLVAIVLFPLVALGPWLVVGPPGLSAAGEAAGAGRRAAVPLLRVLLLGYAVLYTSLDVLAGVGAGYVVHRAAQQGGSGYPAAAWLVQQGDVLGYAGASCLLVAVVGVVLLLVHELRGAAPGAGPGVGAGVGGRTWALVLGGGALTVAASASYVTSHIFPPVGVATMVVLAVGLLVLDAGARRGA